MLAIRVARVFDGSALAAGIGTVLIDDGRVTGLLAHGAALPVDCAVAEYPGATLLPGLVDAHVHLCADGGPGALDRLIDAGDDEVAGTITRALRAHLAAGVTTVRDLGDRRWAVLDWRDRAGLSTIPTVLTAGPPITSIRGHCWHLGGEARGVEHLRDAVRQRIERGVDVVKIMASGGTMTPGTDVTATQFSDDEIRAVVDTAHAAGLPVTAHAHPRGAIQQALAAGVDGIEHATLLPPVTTAPPEPLLAALTGGPVPVCPTLGRAPGAPIPPGVAALERDLGRTYLDHVHGIGSLHAAGVRLISGTDGGISPLKPHGNMALALADLVSGGMSTMDALASATARSADACAIGHRKGRIAAGYDADLLIVDGDPLADIAAVSNVAAVYLAGRQYPDANRGRLAP